MTYSDQAIHYVVEVYLKPAARAGQELVRVRAGDVHRGLGWNNRVPSVCQALTSRRFLDEHELELVGKEGPPSGLGTNVVYTYRLRPKERAEAPAQGESGLERLWGMGREMFRRAGGGEVWLKKERENFYAAGKGHGAHLDGEA